MTDQPQSPKLGLDGAPLVTPEEINRRIAAALEVGVPQIYCNGYINGMTAGDVLTVLERNGKPVAVLNMSFTVAKSIAQGIGTIVAELEAQSGRPMLTTREVENLGESAKKSKE